MSKPSVEIVFPEHVDTDTPRGVNMPFSGLKDRVFAVEEILGWFEMLEVKTIELWIEASVKTGDAIKLFVSAQGKGGVKVTLAPKKNKE